MVGMRVMAMAWKGNGEIEEPVSSLDWLLSARAMTSPGNDAKTFPIRENFATPIALQIFRDM